MANRMGATIDEIDGSHTESIARPAQDAAFVSRALDATSGICAGALPDALPARHLRRVAGRFELSEDKHSAGTR
jgi:hypothetical protein